ncbi:MAG: hypothetical protein HQ541_11140 [Mariniphaga sp.]|nr:hypothetical protein [Mariniphaga sp.]
MLDFHEMKVLNLLTKDNCYDCDCEDGTDSEDGSGCDCVSCDSCDCDSIDD